MTESGENLMLTPQELRVLLADLESDRIERTISTRDTDKFAQAVCAFTNDLPNHRQPGYLVIGVNNQGQPIGLDVTDQLLQNLGALRSDGNIQPLPVIVVAKLSLEGGDVAVVEVQPSDLPPVRYKGQVWIRVGPRKAIASEQEERMLSERRIATARSFDTRPCPEANLKDLSLRLFEEYRAQVVAPDIIEANHRTIEEQLASLRFYDLQRDCPTMAGILLFGKNPRYFLPGAYVQFLRMPGITLTDTPVDQAEISGDLRTLLDSLRGRFRVYSATAMLRGESMTEHLVPEYPEWAAREILHNAVMHRDYQSNTPIRFYWFEDRIEIQSPGTLYGEVTPATITRVNSYRNPVIAEAMKALGYVNRFGYGIQQAEMALAENGNPPLDFTFDRVINVVLRRRRA
jgi:ATP-dependent DNA helicase RecG